MRRGLIYVLTIILLATVLAVAQQPVFDVASVKENQKPGDGGTLRLLPGGGINAEHIPAFSFLTIAYSLDRYQVAGVPDWARMTYYDIVARPAGTATRAETLAMLQSLLADRFKLKFHREPRQVDGYVLQRMRADRLGQGLLASTIDCSTAMTEPRCRLGGMTSTSMKAAGMPVERIIAMMTPMVGGPIEDGTRLTGTFDIDLRWSSELAPTGDAPSIYTAVQEQLGLKLERRKVTVDGFVIDRFERADPD